MPDDDYVEYTDDIERGAIADAYKAANDSISTLATSFNVCPWALAIHVTNRNPLQIEWPADHLTLDTALARDKDHVDLMNERMKNVRSPSDSYRLFC